MGWSIPGYTAEAVLGFGATGEVWRGRDTATGEVVALKRLRVGTGEADRERLRREAALLAAVVHPHVLAVYGMAEVTDGAVLVLEYAAGGSLAGIPAPLSPGEVVGIVAPVATALAEAHRAGFTHGDVSPANVLLAGDGRPLLADLGTARLVGEAAGVVRGTPGYVDPAVLAGASPGPASDVYALAAVAAQVLTGLPPACELADPAGPWRAALAGHGVLGRVVLSGLADRPAARPSAEVLAQRLYASGPAELPAVRGGVASPAQPLTHVVPDGPRRSPSPPGAPARRRRRTRLVVAAAVAAMAGGTGLATWAWRGHPAADADPPPPSWAVVLRQLTDARAAAFAAVEPGRLDAADVAGSPLRAADEGRIAELVRIGRRPRGFHDELSAVRVVSGGPAETVLEFTDVQPAYEEVDTAGRVQTRVMAQPARRDRASLVRTAAGWRLAEVTVLG